MELIRDIFYDGLNERKSVPQMPENGLPQCVLCLFRMSRTYLRHMVHESAKLVKYLICIWTSRHFQFFARHFI